MMHGTPTVQALNPRADHALHLASTVLLAACLALMCFGLTMIYSASAHWAERSFGRGHHYLLRQALYLPIALACIAAARQLPLSWWQRLTYPALIGVTVLLLLVIFGLGHRAGGATRWLTVGPVHIQPVELGKLALINWLAYSLARKTDRMRVFSVGFLPHMLITGILVLLCLKQPDFGSAVMLVLITLLMLFVAGTRATYVFASGLAALPMLYALVAGSESRMRRVRAFLEPFRYRQDEGYQIVESLISFGSGGWFGKGLGEGHQKLFFLPEAHTDFIAATIGEELGFIGVVFTLSAYAIMVGAGVRIAWRTREPFAFYLATGMTLFLALQVLTNFAVVLALLPTKGLVLPFLSYGGSAIVANATAVGAILAVARHERCALAVRHAVTPSKPLHRGRGRPSRPTSSQLQGRPRTA